MNTERKKQDKKKSMPRGKILQKSIWDFANDIQTPNKSFLTQMNEKQGQEPELDSPCSEDEVHIKGTSELAPTG